MRVLIITPNYNPDLGPSAPLFTMLSQGLVLRGHQVSVVTAVPHYPSGIVPSEFNGNRVRHTNENNVDVTRVPLPSLNRANLKNRLWQFLCFQLQATWASLKLDYDAVIVANPALQTWLPFAFDVVIKNKPAIFSVHDVYPDVGIQLGIFKKPYQIDIVSWLERFCLRKATTVRILSESFKPGLISLGIPEAKMSLVYDWVDTDLIHPLPHVNEFSEEYKLADRFVVLYAGNIGLSQGLEHILNAAEMLIDQPDIRFVFVGEGSGRELLQARASEQQLTNVQFIPFQPRERLPNVLASADVSLVILRQGIGAASLPSKVFSIMSSGRPMVVSVEEESETCRLVKTAQAGIMIPPENPGKLVEAILTLKNDKELCHSLGQNGRKWAEQNHSPQNAVAQFEELLLNAVEEHRSLK